MAEKLEDALRDSEQAAKKVSLVAARLIQAAKQVEKAASSGELSQLRVARTRLHEAAKDATRDAEDAAGRWPWSEPEEEELLRSEYMAEVQAAADGLGIPFHPYGESWSAYPVLVRVEPRSKSVRLDRRRVRALRPSVLVRQIQQIRQAKPRQSPEQFLEILYSGYLAVLGGQALESGTIRPEAGAKLVAVHQALTLLPDARKDYPLDEFARDLHQLNLSGLRNTRSGHLLHLAAATSTKSGAGVLTVIDDHDHQFYYFSVAFRKEE